MLGRYLGEFDNAGGPAADRALTDSPRDAATSVRTFAGGLLRYRTDLDVYEDAGDLCLACGNPRFQDAGDARHAEEHGAASAWLAMFRRRGADAPTRVYGRFAVIVVRSAHSEITAVTDRFGTWPICYTETDEGLRVGERADDVAGENPTISPQSLYDYLFFHVIPAPATVFKNVHRLPEAHLLEWRDGKSVCRPYWRPSFDEQSDSDLAGREADFLELVESAVRQEAEVGDVGAFLSGGTDSSTVAGMLCKVTGEAVKTYSMGFAAEGYDEMEFARTASRHFGTEHHEYYVTPGDLHEGIPRVARHYEQPFGNSSTAPAWICAERAKEDGIDKLLAGDGGDELFGGNERYARQLVFERYELLPQVVRRAALEPLLGLPGMDRVPLTRKAASYVEQARMGLPDRLHSYNLLLRIGANNVLEPTFLDAVDTQAPFAMQRDWWDAIDAPSSLDRMLAFDWKYTLVDNDLPKVIGATSMAGLDVGFPLLSDELVELATKLPPRWKLKGGELRWFFKHALRDFLPEAILTKEKHGFGLPFGVWACTDEGLQKLARDTLMRLGQRRIVKEDFLDTLLGEHLPAHPGYYGEMVWILMMLELWLQAHAPEWRFG